LEDSGDGILLIFHKKVSKHANPGMNRWDGGVATGSVHFDADIEVAFFGDAGNGTVKASRDQLGVIIVYGRLKSKKLTILRRTAH
jgi:hypothetical protein